jgi:hypothetical protein
LTKNKYKKKDIGQKIKAGLIYKAQELKKHNKIVVVTLVFKSLV